MPGRDEFDGVCTLPLQEALGPFQPNQGKQMPLAEKGVGSRNAPSLPLLHPCSGVPRERQRRQVVAVCPKEATAMVSGEAQSLGALLPGDLIWPELCLHLTDKSNGRS